MTQSLPSVLLRSSSSAEWVERLETAPVDVLVFGVVDATAAAVDDDTDM
jgi:microcompartment protein CcmK/EutM